MTTNRDKLGRIERKAGEIANRLARRWAAADVKAEYAKEDGADDADELATTADRIWGRADAARLRFFDLRDALNS
jgi:hypothetical protein